MTRARQTDSYTIRGFEYTQRGTMQSKYAEQDAEWAIQNTSSIRYFEKSCAPMWKSLTTTVSRCYMKRDRRRVNKRKKRLKKNWYIMSDAKVPGVKTRERSPALSTHLFARGLVSLVKIWKRASLENRRVSSKFKKRKAFIHFSSNYYCLTLHVSHFFFLSCFPLYKI